MNRRWRAAALALLILMAVWACAGALAEQVARADPMSRPEGDHPDIVTTSARADESDAVETILAGMSVEEKVGQMFFVTRPGNMDTAVKAIKKYALGGYVLYATHFSGRKPASLRKSIQRCQSASKVPMLIAVDEEGGSVSRLSLYKAYRRSRFLSPQALFKKGGFDAVRADAREKAELLLSLGINVNLAPVADVPSAKGDFIYSRSFGTDPVQTAEYIRTVVEESSAAGLGLVLKHFPGYGNNRDTHAGAVVDKRPLETFEERDFLPFEAGFDAGVGAVMVAHNIVNCFDDKYPASLSVSVNKALRGLGFDGVAVTDGLAMRAITKKYGLKKAAVMAVQAGDDMLMCNDYKTGINAVLKAVKDGTISEARLDESVRRILAWKHTLGLI